MQNILSNNYVGFYNNEIEFRKRCGYPPFIDIFLFEFTSKNLNALKKDTSKMYDILSQDKNSGYTVFSPKTPFIQKINNKYRINILMKTKISSNLYKVLYQKIESYNKNRSKDVTMTITKNPLFIN